MTSYPLMKRYDVTPRIAPQIDVTVFTDKSMKRSFFDVGDQLRDG